MFSVKTISPEMLNKLFDSDTKNKFQLGDDEKYSPEFSDDQAALIQPIIDSKAVVVGIDIYQYSRFPTGQQMFIPHLYNLIYNETWHLVKQNYTFLFQEYGSKKLDPREYFISMGDGGYQILPTPLHGVIFILTFATVLRFFNADRFMRKLHAKIGNIEVRYAMTLDEIYRYQDNFYGAGIISNARILGKDRLNRFLIDQNIHNWFLTKIFGVENLMALNLEELKPLKEFSDYDLSLLDAGNNALIPKNRNHHTKEAFKSIDVQKIGRVRRKSTLLDIYNLHLQAMIQYQNFFREETMLTVSVGNLNTFGIGNDDDA